jgi:polyketide synthase-associated protein
MEGNNISIALTSLTENAFSEHGDEISQSIAFQGFCVLHLTSAATLLKEATEEVDALDGRSLLRAPPNALVEALLGEEGSTRIAELKTFDESTPSLQNLNDVMAALCDSLHSYYTLCECSSYQKTDMLVHRGGLDMSLPSEITPEELMRYVNIFSRHMLMFLLFLGPGEGSLELQPSYDVEADAYEIRTTPGILVVLRPDLLSHRHTPDSDDSVLSCWILGQNTASLRPMPAVEQLEATLHEQLMEAKECQLKAEDGGEADIQLPLYLQLEMNRSFFAGQRAAIRGISMKLPGSSSGVSMFTSLTVGGDLVIEVPKDRWDHDTVYDPEPLSYEQSSFYTIRTNVRHGGFIDGVDSFDNKFFGMSPAEARATDPSHKLSLECAYEAMHEAGWSKKTLSGAYLGTYMATGYAEWTDTEKPLGQGPALGGPTVSAARTSFCLGMRGPCITFDNEGAGSLIATALGVQSVVPSKIDNWSKAQMECRASVIGAARIMTTPLIWPRLNNMMDPAGRCFVFDDCASGFCLSEGITFLSVSSLTEKIDGKQVVKEPAKHGTICGWRINSNGANSMMAAPSGAQIQEAIMMAVSQAGINPWDIDAIECHGQAQLLHDSIEAMSMSACLRPPGTESEVLHLGCPKSNFGNAIEPSGLTAICKIAYALKVGWNTPITHLHRLNGHIDMEDEEPLLFSTESLAYRAPRTYHGVSSRSWNGTNAHVTMFGEKDDRPGTSNQIVEFNPLCYWPGGGGKLEASAKPVIGYSVVGSFNDWEPSQDEMIEELDGMYTHVATLGENCTEMFQIWLDGDPARALWPGVAHARNGSACLGPGASDSDCWVIVGEHPGETYKIKLMIAGKHRAVTWERIQSVQL